MTSGMSAVCSVAAMSTLYSRGTYLGRDEQVELRRHGQVVAPGEDHGRAGSRSRLAVACQITATTMIGVEIGKTIRQKMRKTRRRRRAPP